MFQKNIKNIIKELLSNNDKGSFIIKNKSLTPAQVSKQREYINSLLKNKKGFVKRYGKDAEKYMYGAATNKAKKSIEKMNTEKLKEIVRQSLIKKPLNENEDLLSQLEQLLKNHDWFYMMSDDHDKYKKGISQREYIDNLMEKLKSEGKESEAKELFNKISPYKEAFGDNELEEINSKKYIKDKSLDEERFPKGTDIGKKVAGSILNKIINK